MLKRINMEKAIQELLNENEKVYIKGIDAYLRALDRTWSFTEYGGGRCFNETQFYIEVEDNENEEG